MPENLWEKAYHGRKPDLIKVNEHGHEEWYYMVCVGGTDDTGAFQVVLDGPAQGEKAYFYEYS